MAFEGILTNGVSEVLKNLVPIVAQEISLAWGVKDELRKLQTTIEMILSVVADAERRQVAEEALRLWLRRLKDVAYDAEDAIDDFSYETMRRFERGNNLKDKACDFVSSANPLLFRFRMARKIKHINQRLDEITKDMSRFHLQTTPAILSGETSEHRSRQTASCINESDIIGRKAEKERIINMLTKDIIGRENISVVSIVGMGGLGKTTLAQLVYKDEFVNKYFELTMWVHVSEDFDVEKLLTKIMESSTLNKFDALSNFDVLVRRVREQLNGKRYLLVLDDLWNEDAEQWERLFGPLIVGAQGSKILTTTRKRQVADVVKGSISPYFLEKLQADECWSIIERKAFSPGGASRTPDMIKIGQEIAVKCGGLPLAAKFLGSLMHSKNKESNWLSIRENDMWNAHDSKITPILKLSYDNLSPHLQRCFSYCSIFPKDQELSKLSLIQLWMAEGFLLNPSIMGRDCTLEDTGEDYFGRLMSASFFDGVETNELDDVMTFKMHDLVHDLAQAVAGDRECSTVKYTDQLENISEVRRLNLIVDKKFSASTKKISNLKKLRTIIVLKPKYQLNLNRFSCSKHLRILHVDPPSEGYSAVNYTISELRHLRYLHLSNLKLCFDLGDTSSVSKLYHLQTLVLGGCGFRTNLFKGMRSLKHLDISFTAIQELPDSVTSLHDLERLDLNHCKYLTTIPDSVTGLECLTFLDMSSTAIEKLPDFVTSLRNLRTLDVNTCKKLKTLPEYAAGLKNLRIFNFKNCTLLETLPHDFEVLSQLRSLDVEGTKIRVLPESCTRLNNLEYVHLSRCELPKEVSNWIKLRKFYFLNKETPVGIGKLVLLQQLTYRVRDKVIAELLECTDGIEELGNLNLLEMLSILNLENVKDPIDAERANIKGKHNLRKLVLNWGGTTEESRMKRLDQNSCNFQVFEALQPPAGLRRLDIFKSMWSDLPTWMCVPSGTLPNLEFLTILNCREIKQLPESIGQLPLLKGLDLTGLSLKSLDIGGFPSLIELHLNDMFLLQELVYSYPCLQNLSISDCKSLTEIPSFPSLTDLYLDKVDNKLVCSVGRSQTSLTELCLENIEELKYFPISILQNNRNLQTLDIRECNHFEGFGVNDDADDTRYAPDLAIFSLQILAVSGCQNLKFLPDLRGCTSLRRLTIFNCPLVKESLTYDLMDLSFLKYLWVDFIQKDQNRGDPTDVKDLINLLE